MICRNRIIFTRMILSYNNIPKWMYMYDFVIYINELCVTIKNRITNIKKQEYDTF